MHLLITTTGDEPLSFRPKTHPATANRFGNRAHNAYFLNLEQKDEKVKIMDTLTQALFFTGFWTTPTNGFGGFLSLEKNP